MVALLSTRLQDEVVEVWDVVLPVLPAPNVLIEAFDRHRLFVAPVVGSLQKLPQAELGLREVGFHR